MAEAANATSSPDFTARQFNPTQPNLVGSSFSIVWSTAMTRNSLYASPEKYRATTVATAYQYDKFLFPNGQILCDVGPLGPDLDAYCKTHFQRSWPAVILEIECSLAERLRGVEKRLPALEALLIDGQAPETLRPVFQDIIDTLSELVEHGCLNAQMRLGLLYLSIGRYFEPDDKAQRRGVEAILGAQRNGHPNAAFTLGDHYVEKGSLEDAFRFYKMGDQQGCAVCCYQLGQFAEYGFGEGAENLHAAFEFYKRSSKNFYPPATVRMIEMIMENEDSFMIAQSPIHLLTQAMDMGCAEAMLLLAQIYERGGMFGREPWLAASLFRRAAVAGNPSAQLKLGQILDGSDLVALPLAEDIEESIEWYYRVITDQNKSEVRGLAHMYLGRIYFRMRDFGSAQLQYEAAAALGVTDAEVMVKLVRDADDEFFGQELD
jgi:TPR repeat protein